jgi:hypothetical protein
MWRMIRFYNENGCETPKDPHDVWDREIRNALLPIVQKAAAEGVSLRDVQFLISEEAAFLCAEYRLRRGTAEFKAKQAERAAARAEAMEQ